AERERTETPAAPPSAAPETAPPATAELPSPATTEAPPATADAPPAAPPPPARAGNVDVRESLCLMIEAAARSQNLPLEFFARALRAGDLAGEPLPGRRGRPAHAQRRPRAGHRPVHAPHRRRARPARSVRSGAGAAEVGGILARARRPVRQSRPRRRRLQRRA